MDARTSDDYFFTLKEAARFLKISPDTFRRYIKRNKKNPPPMGHPVSKQLRFPKDEFIQWATNGSKKCSP